MIKFDFNTYVDKFIDKDLKDKYLSREKEI